MKCTPRNGKLRIGHGINEVPHQVLALRADLVVFAAEGQDAHLAALAGQLGHAVAVQAGAIDDEIGWEFARRGLGHPSGAAGAQTEDSRASRHAGTRRGEPGHQRVADAGIVHNALLRDAQGGHAAHVRLDLAHLAGAEPSQAFQAVGAAARFQVAETGHLGLVGGHHDFAADLVRDAVLQAKRHHLADARNRQARFDRSGFVIQPGMQHAAVMAGLVAPHLVFLFKHGDAGAGEPEAQTVCGGQSDDAAADDDDASGIHGCIFECSSAGLWTCSHLASPDL